MRALIDIKMSSQKRILSIRMSKLETAHLEPWGFRLQGGIDVVAPLSVLKVYSGSLAEKAGLQAGDTLIQINGLDITHLLHKDARDILSRAGNNFELVISRDNRLDDSTFQTTRLHQVSGENLKVKTTKPLDSEQMKENKHYNNGSSPVMNVAADSDMKSRARDLLMRNLAIFRTKTESKTSLEVNVGQVKPDNCNDGLKPPIKNVYDDIKVDEPLPLFTPASELTIKDKPFDSQTGINEQPKHVSRVEQNPVSTNFYTTSKNLLVESDSDDDLPPPVPTNPPPSSPSSQRQQMQSPILTSSMNKENLLAESDSDENTVPPQVPTNPPPSSPPSNRSQIKSFTGPKPFASAQLTFRVPNYKPVYERFGFGAISPVKEKTILSPTLTIKSSLKPTRMKINEQLGHPLDFNEPEIELKIEEAKEGNVSTVQGVTASPIASLRINYGSPADVGGESSESVDLRSPRDRKEDNKAIFEIQSSTPKVNSAAEQIKFDLTPSIASPRTNLGAHLNNVQLNLSTTTDHGEEIDLVVLRSPKTRRQISNYRNSSDTIKSSATSSTNSYSIIFDLNSSLDSDKDQHQHEYNGNFYSDCPTLSSSRSDKNEEQSSPAVIETARGCWPGMANITAKDIEDVGPLDSELGLLDEEPKAWINSVVDKKLLEELSEKEIKRQEHIYEFIMSEKNHCIALIVIQNIFAKRMRREGFTPEAVDKIFPSCLKHLIEFHFDFLRQLRQRQRHHPVVHTIEDILCCQFSEPKGEELRLLYTDFCNRQQVSIAKFQEMVSEDSKFASFAEKCASNPLCKMPIITCTLYVAQRLTRYPLLIAPLIKTSSNDPPNEELKLNEALAFVKTILSVVNAKIAEKELKLRRIALLDKIDQKSQTNYQGKKFRKLDLISNKRRLMFEGVAYLQQGRSKAQLVTVVVLSDIIIFMYESNQKLHFLPAQDNKRGIIPLPKLLVREKAGGQDAQSIYLISSNADEPELYELQCQTPRDKNDWIRKISAAVENCAKMKEASPKQKNDNSIDEQEDL